MGNNVLTQYFYTRMTSDGATESGANKKFKLFARCRFEFPLFIIGFGEIPFYSSKYMSLLRGTKDFFF